MNKNDEDILINELNKEHITSNDNTKDNTKVGSKVVAVLGDSLVK